MKNMCEYPFQFNPAEQNKSFANLDYNSGDGKLGLPGGLPRIGASAGA